MPRLTFAGLALAALVACQTADTEFSGEELSAIAETVRQEAISLVDSWNTLDPDSHLTYYADEIRYGFEGSFMSGRAFREATSGYMGLFAEYNQVWDDIDVQVLGPNAAVTGVTMHFTTVSQSGESSEGVEAMTLVWSRIGGEWKVVHGHGSLQ